jgi:hypothetical protein
MTFYGYQPGVKAMAQDGHTARSCSVWYRVTRIKHNHTLPAHEWEMARPSTSVQESWWMLNKRAEHFWSSTRKYDQFTKIVLMMNTIVQNALWDVGRSCQILGICRCHLWTSLNSTVKKNVVIRWTPKACQSIYIYIYPFVDYSWYISVSIHSVTYIVMLGTNCTFVRWAKRRCTKHKISPI